MSKLRISLFALALFACLALCLGKAREAEAIEGSWELGLSPHSLLIPSKKIYGAGLEVYGRYNLHQGIHLSMAFASSLNRDVPAAVNLSLHKLKLGLVYAIDIVHWVPKLHLHLDAVFSEHERFAWGKNQNGMGVEMGLEIQYRGFSRFGIGLSYQYQFLFTNVDHMTVGLTFSWFTDDF